MYENIDVISFQIKRTYHNEYFEPIQPELTKTSEVLSQATIMEAYLDGSLSTTACSKMYKKDIFDHVKFSDVPLHEDAWSMHLFLWETKSLLITNQIFYVQYIRHNSLIQNKFRQDNLLAIECRKRLLLFVDENYRDNRIFHYKALKLLIERQLYILNQIICDGVYMKYRQEYEAIVEEIRSEAEEVPYEMLNENLKKHINWVLNRPVYYFIRSKLAVMRSKLKTSALRRKS